MAPQIPVPPTKQNHSVLSHSWGKIDAKLKLFIDRAATLGTETDTGTHVSCSVPVYTYHLRSVPLSYR